jgi:hypothetical protein
MFIERLTLAARRALHNRRRRTEFQRMYDGDTAKRLLLITVGQQIPQSQIYPFHFFADQLREVHDVELREVSEEVFFGGQCDLAQQATTICFQTMFDMPADALERRTQIVRDSNPDALLVYLDWFAPTDLHFAETLAPFVDIYLKKHVFRDRSRYGQPTFGDTNLTDYYGQRFGLPHSKTCFTIPAGFLDKLLVGPSFFTGDLMLKRFSAPPFSEGTAQPIDLQARFEVAGVPWYSQMRAECLTAAQGISGVVLSDDSRIRLDLFIDELSRSKICFSPFGYGEVCWRDYEAIMCGAVLLKQDMSHIETSPDIFLPHETYVPVKWDMSDLADQVHALLDEPERRLALATSAFRQLHDYVTSQGFVEQIAPIIR